MTLRSSHPARWTWFSPWLILGCVCILAGILLVLAIKNVHREKAGLGRLAAGIAHEIRNPLSSIKGFAKILAGRFKEDERSRNIAEVMEQEVERLNRVVTELLDYARPTELQKKTLACKDLIKNSLRLIERDALQQGIRVESTVHPEDLLVEVDPDREDSPATGLLAGKSAGGYEDGRERQAIASRSG